MNICDSGGFDVSGLVVRTTNAAEMEPSTAKIGHLWAQFNKSVQAQLTETSKVYRAIYEL